MLCPPKLVVWDMVPRISWIGVVSDIDRYNNIMFFKLRRVHWLNVNNFIAYSVSYIYLWSSRPSISPRRTLQFLLNSSLVVHSWLTASNTSSSITTYNCSSAIPTFICSSCLTTKSRISLYSCISSDTAAVGCSYIRNPESGSRKNKVSLRTMYYTICTWLGIHKCTEV